MTVDVSSTLTGSAHFHCDPVKMADVDDKNFDILELPEDPAPQIKSSNANVEAAVDEVDIARIEKVYR